MPYVINGNTVQATEPNLKDGTLWVPLRELGEALGGTVDWDPDNRVAIFYLGEHIATLKIGDQTASVDSEQTELQAAPYLDNGDTWVPVRFFNLVGQQINVNLPDKNVEITTTA